MASVIKPYIKGAKANGNSEDKWILSTLASPIIDAITQIPKKVI